MLQASLKLFLLWVFCLQLFSSPMTRSEAFLHALVITVCFLEIRTLQVKIQANKSCERFPDKNIGMLNLYSLVVC